MIAIGPPPENPRSSVRTFPIRLPPVSGESLDSWLWAYAVRLGVPFRELTAAAGLADAFAHQPARSIALGRNLDDQQALASATGVDTPAQDRLWRPLANYAAAAQARFTSRSARRLAMPMASSRFCPSCISANGDRWKMAWRLPWHTVCEDHRCILADRCPQCGTHQRQHVLTEAGGEPLLPGRCASRIKGERRGEACGHRLDSTATSPDRALEPSLAFQRAVALSLGLDASDHSRAEAFDLLADVLLIRTRLDASLHPSTNELAPVAELAPLLVGAWDLRRGQAEEELLRLVERDSQLYGVVPRTWLAASPSLTARVVASRDAFMLPTDRLRWRSATRPQRPSEDGLRESMARARYVPQALWADWAVRLAPPSGVDHTAFRVAAAAALLAPGTPRPFSRALNGTCHEGLAPKVSHALSAVSGGTELTATLQALAQLADGLDKEAGVIDYRRRRELATSVDM